MLHTGIVMALLLLSVFVWTACSSLQIGTRAEPTVIIVRNSTGADLAEASLSEAKDGNNASRYGSIAPVPRGASQVFVRPTKTRNLPGSVNLAWIDAQGDRYSRELSLKKELRTATGEKDEALVFDILPQGDVSVYLELQGLSSAPGLEDIEWRLVEVEGRAIPVSVGGKWLFMRLDPIKKQATGYAGCNTFFAGYTLEGASLSFGPIGSARRACGEPDDEMESAYLKALGATRSWQIRDDALLLEADKVLARFKRADDKGY